MLTITKINDCLNITFKYDTEVIEKIKTIPGRKYQPKTKSWVIPLRAIHKLKLLFNDEELNFDENVDQNYKVERYNFEFELETIEDMRLRKFAKWGLEQLPDYFYEIGASSTGKHHPQYGLGYRGLVRHTIATVKIANELFRCEIIQNFTNIEKDIIRTALLLHDGLKLGINESSYTVSTHPLESVRYIEDIYFNKLKEPPSSEIIEVMETGLWQEISNCIKTHMGQWNTDYKTKKEILPKPQTGIQRFTHLCDYLASRKILEVNFDACE